MKVGGSALLGHLCQSRYGFYRPDQHGATLTCWTTDKVQTPMQAVNLVDVSASGRPEHRRIPGCHSPITVRRGIVWQISFGLDNFAPNAIDVELRSNQILRNNDGISGKILL